MSDSFDDILELIGKVAEVAGNVLEGLTGAAGAVAEGASAVAEVAGPVLAGAAESAGQIVTVAAEGGAAVVTGGELVSDAIDVVASVGEATTSGTATPHPDQVLAQQPQLAPPLDGAP